MDFLVQGLFLVCPLRLRFLEGDESSVYLSASAGYSISLLLGRLVGPGQVQGQCLQVRETVLFLRGNAQWC